MGIITHAGPIVICIRKSTTCEKPPNSWDWSGLPCLPFPEVLCLGAAAGPSPSHEVISSAASRRAAGLQSVSTGSPQKTKKSLARGVGATASILLPLPSLTLIACCTGDWKRQSSKANPTQLPPRTEDLSLSFCLLFQHHLQLCSHLVHQKEGVKKSIEKVTRIQNYLNSSSVLLAGGLLRSQIVQKPPALTLRQWAWQSRLSANIKKQDQMLQ